MGMTSEQEEHLRKIKTTFNTLVDEKYRIGQAEHGGSLYNKNGLLDMAIEEVLDLAVYLFTLQQQQNGEYDIIDGLKDLDE